MASVVLPSVALATQQISRVQASCCAIHGVISSPGSSSRSSWKPCFGTLRPGSYGSSSSSRAAKICPRAKGDREFSGGDVSNSDAEPQIILPNLDTPDYLYKEIGLTKAAGEDAEEPEQNEEEEGDPWLLEFQNEIDRVKQTWSDVESIKNSWNQSSDYSDVPHNTSRRRVLGAPMFMSLAYFFTWGAPARKASALEKPAKIDSTTTPSSAQFDARDQRLQNAASVFRQALEAPTVEDEERLWTEVITISEDVKAEWVPDILARAYGNRGNARSRQGNLEQALLDYDRSIELAPYAVDPVLNRGVALESLGRYEEACADYEAVLKAQPDDAAAWNNLGNVKAAVSKWDDALRSYSRAVQLAPKFSFAAANYALALYQVGRDNEAIRQFRNLLRRYPEFADVRAALAVSLYEQGLYGEAETNWGRLEDGRYRDREWVKTTRRWPPRLVSALEDFLDVKQNSAV
ncbi:hypothetical protein R1sor_007381 [Riccia sorocarpa]|uniref:Cytochrome c-type biogenesis protein H TPR domain-containing protein n=1 Tax=Riccia sorocarpa TaxID=122646 RepID=A0ABD3HTX6_9MARC